MPHRDWRQYDFLVGEAPQAPLAGYDGPFYYAGPALRVYDDDKRLLRIQDAHNQVWHFQGGKGHERLVKYTTTNHRTYYFKGRKGYERKVRCESTWPDKRSQWQTEYYKGPRGNEYMVRAVDRDSGAVRHYIRARIWHEPALLKRQVQPDGYVLHFTTYGAGYPQLVRSRSAQGRTMHFNRPIAQDCWTKYHVEPNGTVEEFDPATCYCDDDRMLRKVYPDGTIEHVHDHWYPKVVGEELCECMDQYLLAVEHPDGRVCYPKPDWPASKPVPHRSLRDNKPLDWAAYSRAYYWARVREWVKARAIALHWQERTQVRLAAPSGAGRAADLAAFVTDFGA